MTLLVFYYMYLIYSLNIPKHCQNFCVYVHETNSINLILFNPFIVHEIIYV